MAGQTTFLAMDLGAESGRAVAGKFDGERVKLEEIHRFPNVPVRLPDGLHWDALRIVREVKEGLAKAARTERMDSVGIDSWGVDFGLLDRDGLLVSNPYHYRDVRTDGAMEEVLERMSKEEIYRATGIQFLPFNTLYQVLAMRDSPLLGAAETLLLIPDLMNYWLTGEKVCEYTNATTTQLYDLGSSGWNQNLLKDLEFPTRILAPIIPPATGIGPLLPEVVEEVGARVPVVAVASHDTASAVVAVPARGSDFAYISSGTWSLVGVELPGPIVTREAMEANFTNEGGFGGRTRFLRNVMGLWLLQECRGKWAGEGRDYSYEELVRLAEDAPAGGALLDPDHPTFLTPGDMPSRIRSFCEATGQKPPEEPGEFARCVFESLALKYQYVIEQARDLTGLTIDEINVVGGGSRNALLCQMTADAAQLPVVAGPVEATAVGNVMVQAFAGGRVGSLEEIRAVVRRSFETSTYEPDGSVGEWSGLRARFRRVMDKATRLDPSEGG